MKRKIAFGTAALCFSIFGLVESASALPFYENPKSFQQYLNALDWGESKRIRFQGLSQCGTRYSSQFGCGSGFVTISDPRGTQTCSLEEVYYSSDNRRSYYTKQRGSCRWDNGQQVVEYPQYIPQPVQPLPSGRLYPAQSL